MPDRFTAPTRYEMLLAAEAAIADRLSDALRTGEPTADLMAWNSELQADIKDHELQMLGLWRLTRSEAQAAQKGGSDAQA